MHPQLDGNNFGQRFLPQLYLVYLYVQHVLQRQVEQTHMANVWAPHQKPDGLST